MSAHSTDKTPRSLALAGYLAINRGSAVATEDWPGRPEGKLVWVHVARAERMPAVMQLGARLRSMMEQITILVTLAPGLAEPRRGKEGFLWLSLPADTQSFAEAFVGHFRPDCCIWTSGDLRPALIDAAARRDVPLVLVDAVADGFGERSLMRLKVPVRGALALFSVILASDANAANRLAKLGVPRNEIDITGPLQEGSAALPARPDDLDDLSAAIGPRPVWLAAMVQPEEITTILRAHRAASRFSHRLMLVLVPDKPEMAEDALARARRENLRAILWSDGAFPDEQTEVVIGDTTGEMGLWYRVASVSFMASSLVAGKGGCDPFEPAALGSAVLYGPNCGRHLHAYSRLVEVGAARMVRDIDTLAGALRTLSAPDRAAAMALAAWDVVSEGAQVADKVTDLIQDILDLAEVA